MPAERMAVQQAREDRAIYRALKLLEGRLRKPGECLGATSAVRQFLTLHLAQEDREVFSVLWLDAQNRLIVAENIFFGTLTQTSVYPREVVRRGLLHNAASVIFAHNHPSGNATPSREDLMLTCVLMGALKLVSIQAHDHFIVAGLDVVSLAGLGLMGMLDFPEANEPPKKAKQARKKRQ